MDVSQWIADSLAKGSPLTYQLVDLAELNLPMLDEPVPAAFHDYRHEHTRKWSALVTGFDAFVFVFPQYNWGYPGVLKNALDFLYDEWGGKPASVVTYGMRGGARGAAQLIDVLHGLHMDVTRHHVEVVVTPAHLNVEGQLIDRDATLGPSRDAVRELDMELAQTLTGGR